MRGWAGLKLFGGHFLGIFWMFTAPTNPPSSSTMAVTYLFGLPKPEGLVDMKAKESLVMG